MIRKKKIVHKQWSFHRLEQKHLIKSEGLKNNKRPLYTTVVYSTEASQFLISLHHGNLKRQLSLNVENNCFRTKYDMLTTPKRKKCVKAF